MSINSDFKLLHDSVQVCKHDAVASSVINSGDTLI